VSGDAIGSFFSEQSARVRGGKFFSGTATAHEALKQAEQAMANLRFNPARRARAGQYAAGSWIAADEGAGRFADGLLSALGPSMRSAFEREMVPFASHIINEWPEKTGRSKSALALDVDVTPEGLVTMKMIGGDPKTFYVKYKLALRKETFKMGVLRYIANVMGTSAKVAADPDALALAAAQFKITTAEANQIWTDRLPERRVYRLPDGTDAQGAAAWAEQAAHPFKPMVERMAKTCGIALSRNAAAFTARSP